MTGLVGNQLQFGVESTEWKVEWAGKLPALVVAELSRTNTSAWSLRI